MNGKGFRRLPGLVALAGLLLATVAASAAARGQAVPQNTSQPTIDGTPRVGSTLRAGVGTWTNAPTSYRYRWLRCDNVAGQNCVQISGATASTYKLSNSDRNRAIDLWVRACNANGCSGFVNSRPVGPISANTVPQATSPPSISGPPVVGGVLTANNGTWTGLPDRYGYEWQLCDPNGAACAVIAGATTQTYTPRNTDVGHTVRVRVTATNPRGTGSATSAQSDVIAQPTGGTASIPVSSVMPPNRLNVTGVQFVPSVLRSMAPFVARFKVTEAKGRAVGGALVYAIALPYEIARTAPEAVTGADGWATITFRPTTALPRRGAVVFFVRARKPGDSLLAGVSTRRLVQVTVRR